ncbi:25247_t:CDS:2, partial [Racocetra persica]
PIQIKYRSTENLQIYDPRMNHESGPKTLNHYLRDFDKLLSHIIFDENENSFRIRYGIFIVNDKVHIPEWYPSTTNIVMGKQTQFYGSEETILNKIDRAMIAAHTDTVETIFKNLSNETWSQIEKDQDMKVNCINANIYITSMIMS